ncbi:hypothetical protein [Microbacterium foliorum]|uniref:hypothetical protein n=1 Tax=Microbacterium foliorum TaxID=104336 RepID=UPI00099F4F38|nr:hypothetical protein [Microbacterium foliorum]AQY00216.1 hypothetical protein B2G67_00955 [Microbacterium foliorum]
MTTSTGAAGTSSVTVSAGVVSAGVTAVRAATAEASRPRSGFGAVKAARPTTSAPVATSPAAPTSIRRRGWGRARTRVGESDDASSTAVAPVVPAICVVWGIELAAASGATGGAALPSG